MFLHFGGRSLVNALRSGSSRVSCKSSSRSRHSNTYDRSLSRHLYAVLLSIKGNVGIKPSCNASYHTLRLVILHAVSQRNSQGYQAKDHDCCARGLSHHSRTFDQFSIFSLLRWSTICISGESSIISSRVEIGPLLIRQAMRTDLYSR